MRQFPSSSSDVSADPGLGPGLVSQPPAAVGTQPLDPGSPANRATQFRPDPGGGEATSAAGLLAAAYIVMWVLLLAFVWLNSRRQRQLEVRISALETALDAHEKGARS